MTWLETPGGVAAALNRYDRIYNKEASVTDPETQNMIALGAAVQGSLSTLYRTGLSDGMEIALKLMLGQEAEGGIPFKGPLSADAQNYAMAALAAIAKVREELKGE